MATSDIAPRVAARRRDGSLDGIRGYAIILVVLSHLWLVAPTTDLTGGPWWWLFSSGNYAVTLFFVVGGYLATASMLREVDRTGTVRVGVGFARRWIRLSAHVYPLVLVVLLMTALDSQMHADYSGEDTRRSALHIVTYTWTSFLHDHPAEARPDLGHLWYVCTDLWVISIILALTYLLGRRRIALLAALAATLVLCVLYRGHVYETEGIFNALIQWQTRADGLLWGAIAAVVTPWFAGRPEARAHAGWVGVLAALSLIPLIWAVNDNADYVGAPGMVLAVAMAVLVVAICLAPGRGVVAKVLGWAPLRIAGVFSLVLYVWHYPVFWYVAHQGHDWSWQMRTTVALIATVAIALIAQQLVERPLQRLLRSERWRTLDDGLGHAISAATRSRSSDPR